MGLCENVYRRGGVYWWRRRLRCSETTSNYIRLSLMVRDPRAARRLASRVSVEADRIESVPMLRVEQQKDLLKIFVTAQTAQLERFGRLASHHDVDRGENAEPLELQIRRKKRMAAVCHLLAARGRSAQVMPDDAARLHSAGFTVAEIDDIRSQVALLRQCLPARRASGAVDDFGEKGLFGPDNDALCTILEEYGALPSWENVDQLRNLWLRGVAQAYDATCKVEASAFPPEFFDGRWGSQPPGPMEAQTADRAPDAPCASTLSVPEESGADYTISGQMQRMIDLKRGTEWKISKRGDQDVCDAAEQYAFAARLLIKVVGVDDVRRLRQDHVIQFRTALQELPTSFGKSPGDWDLSIEAASTKARAAGRPIGRSERTVEKLLTQLASFMRMLQAGVGVAVNPDLIKLVRPKTSKKQKANTFRSAFSVAEMRSLFEHATWSGSVVVHGSLYWAPLMARYTLARIEELCGLLLEDVDLGAETPAIIIRTNKRRTVKSDGARRVPLHPELLRLGFVEYCQAVELSGAEDLFPDLRARGTATSIGSLFNKQWQKVLDEALPMARAEKKTAHSFRKTGNNELRSHAVDESLRKEIMGHEQSGVHASVYLDAAPDDVKLAALVQLSNVTSHLEARPIRLNVGLKRPLGRKPPRRGRASK